MRHLYISAAHKSSGKTSVSIGLCAALHARGDIVQPFKKGPDYIDPLWLSQAAGRPCYNLDFYTMERSEISDLFVEKVRDADIALIEGNKGLFDGLDIHGSNSNAALAIQLEAPVILVLDTQGMTRGVAPLILGYQAFERELQIAGVILNKVGGSRHESKLRAVIEHYTDVPVIGSVRRSDEMHISERHLGLVPSNELSRSVAQIDRMGEMIADQVDLDRLREIGGSVADQPASANSSRAVRALARPVRIAIARDEAFGFYYQSDLDALVAAGGQLLTFSPIADEHLPDCDALFLGGGFPETHINALSGNKTMLEDIRQFIDGDGVAYAECGGLMYLCRNLTWGSKQGKMAGVIPADVMMHDRPQGRGYVRLRENTAHPWPSDSTYVQAVSAHEFHYSSLTNISDRLTYAYKVERGYGIDGERDGIRYRNMLASYAHLRDTRNNHWANRFVEFARRHHDSA